MAVQVQQALFLRIGSRLRLGAEDTGQRGEVTSRGTMTVAGEVGGDAEEPRAEGARRIESFEVMPGA